jgi:hypothetical protein
LENLLEHLGTTSSATNHPLPEAVLERSRVELLNSWVHFFEILIELGSFTEAFDAVIHIAEIESTIATTSRYANETYRCIWKDRLQSMVMHACSTGNLDWLCSLPDAWITATQIPVSSAMIDEMVALAESKNGTGFWLPHDGIEGATIYDAVRSWQKTTNYEALVTFFLLRQEFKEAASSLNASAKILLESNGDNQYRQRCHLYVWLTSFYNCISVCLIFCVPYALPGCYLLHSVVFLSCPKIKPTYSPAPGNKIKEVHLKMATLVWRETNQIPDQEVTLMLGLRKWHCDLC